MPVPLQFVSGLMAVPLFVTTNVPVARFPLLPPDSPMLIRLVAIGTALDAPEIRFVEIVTLPALPEGPEPLLPYDTSTPPPFGKLWMMLPEIVAVVSCAAPLVSPLPISRMPYPNDCVGSVELVIVLF